MAGRRLLGMRQRKVASLKAQSDEVLSAIRARIPGLAAYTELTDDSMWSDLSKTRCVLLLLHAEVSENKCCVARVQELAAAGSMIVCVLMPGYTVPQDVQTSRVWWPENMGESLKDAMCVDLRAGLQTAQIRLALRLERLLGSMRARDLRESPVVKCPTCVAEEKDPVSTFDRQGLRKPLRDWELGELGEGQEARKGTASAVCDCGHETDVHVLLYRAELR